MFTSDEQYTTLAKFSGRTMTSHVTSLRNEVWIGFYINSISASFSLEITAVNQTDEITLDTTDSYFIQSPGYPAEYPQNCYRFWKFQAVDGFVVSVIVHHFDLEFNRDHLYIGEGASRFSNQMDRWHDLTGNLIEISEYRYFISLWSPVLIIFTTDFVTVESGFQIELRAMEQVAQSTLQSVTMVYGVTTIPISSSPSERDSNDVITLESSAVHPGTTINGVLKMQWTTISSKFSIIFGALSASFSLILLVILLRYVGMKFRRCHHDHLTQAEGRIYCTVTDSAPVLPPRRFIRQHASPLSASPPDVHRHAFLDDESDSTMDILKNSHALEDEVFSEVKYTPYPSQQVAFESSKFDGAYACVPDPLGKYTFDESDEIDKFGFDRPVSRACDVHEVSGAKPRAICNRCGLEKVQYDWSAADDSQVKRYGPGEGCSEHSSPRRVRPNDRYGKDDFVVSRGATSKSDDDSSSVMSCRSGLGGSRLSESSNDNRCCCLHSNEWLQSDESCNFPPSKVKELSTKTSIMSTEDLRFSHCDVDEFGYLICETSTPKSGGFRQLTSNRDEKLRYRGSSDHWSTSDELDSSPNIYSVRESVSSSSTIEHTYLEREYIE
ncbi:uncharacterized protein LOC121424372 [Lytechinus variegatus]|uniref:uncharacterized protein LOC121424372 n=1 Tax=Lytechinus variegatus TaxID=7654 RepID=UPI001BB0DFC8|nr:uncharacterized protein LOC121424372 [Lytechinus variegatus]